MTKEEFLKIVTPIAILVEKKSEDYDSGIALEEYFPMGDRSYFQMVWTKALRLKSIVLNERELNFEGLLDTVDDMIAYLVFFRKHLAKQQKKR